MCRGRSSEFFQAMRGSYSCEAEKAFEEQTICRNYILGTFGVIADKIISQVAEDVLRDSSILAMRFKTMTFQDSSRDGDAAIAAVKIIMSKGFQ